ncbi:hypothetical protein NDU88_001805 [Pleurodeles waltl]|uniref:Uncharacterized protein n=1 Tax=Pleurodeles waltl TaxID=8319 RepID=A0AAV7W251_PLEWA|nr:hypothetical protein NDU88_001805 [Pleurodeles waltl]
MELNKVVQALKTLRDEGREDLFKDGVLEEAWVGLKRPKRLSSQGVSAAVAACSSPTGKPKKLKNKSAEGRKVTRSPERLHEVLGSALGSAEVVVPRRRGAGHLVRRSGVSLARRVSAGGRVAGHGAVAGGERQGAQLASARAAGNERSGRVLKQAQLPRENAAERKAAILEERHWGGISKMAAPSEKHTHLESLSNKGQLAEGQSIAARMDQGEEVIVISDEEQEGQEGFELNKRVIAVPAVSYFGKGAGADGSRESSFEGGLCIRSIGRHVGSQNVFNVGEQVDFVDQDGVRVKGMVCGQIGSGDGRGEARVLLDIWQPGVQEVSAGCDAPRFLGRLSEVTVHQDAVRHSGGQSFPVKARAPLVHRKEGRVNSGAVYPTTREAVAGCSLGHGAGSVFDEQPSTSWGVGARLERQDDILLDYEEDVEDQATMVAASVLPSTVPEVVQGDRSGNRRKATAGNLPRGEIGGDGQDC